MASALLTSKVIYPRLLAVVMVFVTSIPLSLPGVSYFVPMVDIMFVYYWCVYRPHVAPAWFLFVIGILRDSIAGAPLGIHALTNLLVRALVIFRRDAYFKQPFVILWQGFAMFAAVALLCKWVLFSFVYGNFLSVNMAFMQLLLSISIYPLVHYIFHLIYAMLPGDPVDA